MVAMVVDKTATVLVLHGLLAGVKGGSRVVAMEARRCRGVSDDSGVVIDIVWMVAEQVIGAVWMVAKVICCGCMVAKQVFGGGCKVIGSSSCAWVVRRRERAVVASSFFFIYEGDHQKKKKDEATTVLKCR
ncbi:hypothetical protein L6452_05278 [Arctium lappa]|uniref:Uncharacterized protein n=1 Tax=Arctium lappa TaxID=4217 RepID=A0ACB9EG91_ARCLA|nr:hypothetical protein L6452_05278 [Arctium lappa]